MPDNAHPLYRRWERMRSRCNQPTNHKWKYYGGRGIRCCERWAVFKNFLADMGPCPPGFTLDRIDPNGNYEPGNCRWASVTDQNNNQRARAYSASYQRKTVIVDTGVAITQAEAAKRLGIQQTSVERRLYRMRKREPGLACIELSRLRT